MKLTDIVEVLYEYFLYVFFPPYCVFCGKRLPFRKYDNRVCDVCEENIPYIKEEMCGICGKPVSGDGICEACLRNRPVFAKGIAAFAYEDVRDGIARFKYKDGKIDGDKFGELMGEYLLMKYSDWIGEIDVMTPVPLHSKKQLHRGFNQSSILCEWISEVCDIPYEEGILKRIKYTIPQSKIAGEQRYKNMDGVFSAKECTGKVILLVDDIYTTGATANECSRMLYRSGAKEVRVFCLSHTKQ